jgi:hypothetical protein
VTHDTGTIPYEQVRTLVAQGWFVVFAAGSIDGEPCCAWLATRLRPSSAAMAYSLDEDVRVGQMYGALDAVREHFSAHGFTPA